MKLDSSEDKAFELSRQRIDAYYSVKFKKVLDEIFPDESELFKELVWALKDAYVSFTSKYPDDDKTNFDMHLIRGLGEAYLTCIEAFEQKHPNSLTEDLLFKLASFERAYQMELLETEAPFDEETVCALDGLTKATQKAMFIWLGKFGTDIVDSHLNPTITAVNEFYTSKTKEQKLVKQPLRIRWRANDPIGLHNLVKIMSKRISPRASEIESVLQGKNHQYTIRPGKLDAFIWLISELDRLRLISTSPTKGHFRVFETLLASDNNQSHAKGYFRKRAYEIRTKLPENHSVKVEVRKILTDAKLL